MDKKGDGKGDKEAKRKRKVRGKKETRKGNKEGTKGKKKEVNVWCHSRFLYLQAPGGSCSPVASHWPGPGHMFGDVSFRFTRGGGAKTAKPVFRQDQTSRLKVK